MRLRGGHRLGHGVGDGGGIGFRRPGGASTGNRRAGTTPLVILILLVVSAAIGTWYASHIASTRRHRLRRVSSGDEEESSSWGEDAVAGSDAAERHRLFDAFVRRSVAAGAAASSVFATSDGVGASSSSSSFRDFLSERGTRDDRTGIVVVDPPVHFGGHAAGEEEYIRQMGGVEQTRDLENEIADGLRALLGRRRWEDGGERDVISREGPVLELGAGQGTMSRPIVRALGDSYPYVVLSDTSAGFLKYTRETLTPNVSENADAGANRVEYVTLGSLTDVPSESVSLLALRYVLHHIPDWKQFIREASRVLLPGGVLLMEEPVADGFFVQRAIVSSCLEGAVAPPPPRRVRKDLEYFVSRIGLYLRTDVDKSSEEDKHLFSQHELYHACQEAGMAMRLFPNQGLVDVSAGAPGLENGDGGDGSGGESGKPPIRHKTFSSEFRHNFVQNFQFGEETVAFFEKVCYPPRLRAAMNVVDGTVNGPVVKGVVFAVKTR